MVFDTHAHMNDRAFDEDRDAVMEALPSQGVGLLMNAGCSLESTRECIALAEKYDFAYASAGSHPDAADEVCDAVLEAYRQLCKACQKSQS